MRSTPASIPRRPELVTADRFIKTVLPPEAARRVAPELARTRDAAVWVHHYRHPREPWTLAIATHAAPGSEKLSLGGFRIAPKERTDLPGFDPDHEAIDLAIGMEEKVHWSRVIGAGGPLARRDSARIVGGKCVLEPTPDARVGQPRDFEILDFAIACLNDCAASNRIHITTGQDLGHGVMSDGRTKSLEYLHRGFPGSVVADTSGPTAEGNYYVLRGMLAALGISVANAAIGLVGVGNIGWHVLDRLCSDGARLFTVESSTARRARIAAKGIRTRGPEGKAELLGEPIDALVVNAAGGSLDPDSVARCVANPRLAVICGSENLVMPDPSGAETLRRARKVYAPTELGGMMGYLTAVEEYLAHLEGQRFAIEPMFEAAKRLEEAGREGAKRVIERDFAISFEQAIEEVFRG